jgi:hypothetical protein
VLDDRPEPIAVGAQLDEVGAGAAQGVALRLHSGRRRLGETALDAGGDTDLPRRTRGGVDERDETDRRDVALALVVDRDRQQVIAHAETCQRIGPAGAGEVGDDAHEAAPPAEPVDAADRPAEVAAAEVLARWR